jgi:hypothetical protein
MLTTIKEPKMALSIPVSELHSIVLDEKISIEFEDIRDGFQEAVCKRVHCEYDDDTRLEAIQDSIEKLCAFANKLTQNSYDFVYACKFGDDDQFVICASPRFTFNSQRDIQNFQTDVSSFGTWLFEIGEFSNCWDKRLHYPEFIEDYLREWDCTLEEV